MTTEEFETVPLASVPAKTRKEGSMSLALRALGPGQAIRMAIPTERLDRARGTWTAAANRSWGHARLQRATWMATCTSGARAMAMTSVPRHVHRWRIAERAGPTSPAHCPECGAEREMPNSHAEDRGAQAGRWRR